MKIITTILVVFVALEHVYFLILEMFYWTRPKGRRVFGLEKDFAEQSKVLAANQGLYNGFLAAGLVWGLFPFERSVLIFFLTCVAIAGIFGAYSTKKAKLFFVQSLPAIITLILILAFL